VVIALFDEAIKSERGDSKEDRTPAAKFPKAAEPET